MQLRGPGSFQNDFDSAMLMAFKGMLVRIPLSNSVLSLLQHLPAGTYQRSYTDDSKIMEALFSGKACFLDSEEWQYVKLQTPSNSISAQFYEKTNELARCITSCPWLVTELYTLPSLNPSETSTQLRAIALVHRAFEVYGRLQKWYEDFTAFAPSPEEVPSSTNDPLYPVVYRYYNSATATTFCGYYATILILQRILTQFHHPAGDIREISLTVDKICKSIEYLAETGILGPYRAGFAMRVAFEVGTVTTKLWIRKWLIKFEKLYKACSPNNYPPIDAKEDST